MESINISGRHLHLQHHLHRVSSIVRHQMSKGHDASTEDEIIRHENSDTTTPRVYKESLRRPVKNPSTAPTLFATHYRFEQREHFLKNFLEGDDRSANTGLPLEEQDPVLHHCLREATRCAIPGQYSEQLYNGNDSHICSVYSVFVL